MSIQYLKNEALETIRPDWRGNPHDGTEFLYEHKALRPNFANVFKMMTTPNPDRKAKKNDKWRPTVRKDTSYLDSKEDYVVWLGHATFLIQLNGVRMITDPIFYGMPFIPRLIPLAFPVSELKDIDYVLLSHDHRDHADKKSFKEVLKTVKPKAVLTSLNMSKTIGGWLGNTPSVEAGWYQKYDTPGVTITYLPAQHWCRRGLTDFNRTLWGSFMIEANGKTVYFAADSGYDAAHFENIGKHFPNIDLALVGIGAYKPRYMMSDFHSSPQEGFQATLDLGAKRMLPMHYGTYDLSEEPISEPYREVEQSFLDVGLRDRLVLADVGEMILL